MDRNELIHKTIQLAIENVTRGGGPFAAMVVKDGRNHRHRSESGYCNS